MRTTLFTRVRTAVLAVTALGASSFLNAQIGLPVAQKGQKAAVTNLPNRTLQRTTFQASSGGVVASCPGSFCLATAVAFTRPISCPVKTGKTCTLYLHIESSASISTNDNGLFRFLIDGLAPVPGPTDPDGYFAWVSLANFGTSSESYAVVARVKNTSDNQLHSVEVDIGCSDQNGDGCAAGLGFASMSTGVFTP